MPVQRVRHVTELVAYLEPREPVTTPILVRVLADGLRTFGNKAWWVSGPEGERTGLVVLERLPVLGGWRAHVHLEDPQHAPDAAALIQRCPARSFSGIDSSVEAMRGLVPRASKNPRRRWFFSWPAMSQDDYLRLGAAAGIKPVAGVECRQATAAELGEVLALYRDYELNGGAPIRHIRRRLAADIRAGAVAVAEADGEVVAASSIQRTRRFALTNSITVAPQHRGNGLGGALSSWQNQREGAGGRGACGERAMSNGMRTNGTPAPDSLQLVYTSVGLAPRLPFRGRERLRVALLGLQGRRARPRPERTSHPQLPDGPPGK